MKVLVGAFNQEKALVGAFSVNVKTDGSFTALVIVLFPSAFSYHLLLRFTSLQSRGVAATAP